MHQLASTEHRERSIRSILFFFTVTLSMGVPTGSERSSLSFTSFYTFASYSGPNKHRSLVPIQSIQYNSERLSMTSLLCHLVPRYIPEEEKIPLLTCATYKGLESDGVHTPCVHAPPVSRLSYSSFVGL